MARPDDELPPRNDDPDSRQAQQWHQLAGVGIEFIVAVMLFGAIGWWVDGKLNTRPWLMLVGGLVGFAVGLWLMLRTAFRSFKD